MEKIQREVAEIFLPFNLVDWGGVGGLARDKCPFVALSCKLKLARFSAELILQDRAECGNI